MENNLIGTWKLSSVIINQEDGRKDTHHNFNDGLLIYTNNGYMSVSINIDLNENNIVEIYSGKYEIKNDSVIHHVNNSNDIKKINHDLERKFNFNEDKSQVELTAHTFCPGTRTTLIWERL